MQVEWKHCIKAGITVFALFLVIHYWEGFTSVLSLLLGAATPIIIGFAIAYIINILMTFYLYNLLFLALPQGIILLINNAQLY